MKSKKMANGGASGSVDQSDYGRDMMAQEPASGMTLAEQAAKNDGRKLSNWVANLIYHATHAQPPTNLAGHDK